MKISIEWHDDQFNVSLSNGPEPFLTVKGCRIVDGRNGAFISWPARKMDNGKYWNHVYASDKFNAAVLAEASKAKTEGRRPAPSKGSVADMDDDIPFN